MCLPLRIYTMRIKRLFLPAEVSVIEGKLDLQGAGLLVEPPHSPQIHDLVQIALRALCQGKEALRVCV